ncbi:MAG: hypothetical protein ACD_79C00732G0002 [uncultured bacterium]|nr:MAG: hypothetical protein ACD_79C00732G0002 [uncultured bacterium]
MKKEYRDNVEIILVSPSEPGNIGGTARAMNNMGFSHLGLVTPVDYKIPETYKFAWNSHEIVDNAKVYDSIPSAIKDKGYVVAMSTRKGRDRGRFEVLNDVVPEIHELAAKTKVAVIFGCESWGLTNDDLLHANRVVRIHTADKFPSLNLSQAVLVTCYELFNSKAKIDRDRLEPASREALELCFTHIEKVLAMIGYGDRGDRLLPKNIIKSVKKLVGRAILDPHEVAMLRGMCSQVEKTIEGFKLRKDKQDGIEK